MLSVQWESNTLLLPCTCVLSMYQYNCIAVLSIQRVKKVCEYNTIQIWNHMPKYHNQNQNFFCHINIKNKILTALTLLSIRVTQGPLSISL